MRERDRTGEKEIRYGSEKREKDEGHHIR